MNKKRGNRTAASRVPLALFSGFYEIEYCYHYQNEAHDALNVVGRKQLVGWVVGGLDGVSKQDCTENYDKYSCNETIDFHRQHFSPFCLIVLSFLRYVSV